MGGSVPGARDDELFGREYPFDGSVLPGADDDDLFGPVSPFAARLYEPPTPISATVVMAPSDRSFLLMFHSFE